MKTRWVLAVLASITVGCGGAERTDGDDEAAILSTATSEGSAAVFPAVGKSLKIGKKEACVEIDGLVYCGLKYLNYNSYELFYDEYGDEYCQNIPVAEKHAFCSGQTYNVCSAASCTYSTSYYGFLCVGNYTLRCYADCWTWWS